MDLLTHGLLGGLVAQTAGRPQERRLAVGIGFLAALLADADILIRSASDPLLVLEYHRQFSHSLLFIRIGALIASALAWPFVRRRLPPARIYLYAILGYATAGLLDACTSYGTHLFWPFVDRPVSLSIIAVIDPLFTLILLAGVVTVLRQNRRFWGSVSLCLAAAYLALGAVQHQRALDAATELARDRGQQPERQLVKPTMGNLVLWRAVTVFEGEAFLDGVRPGLGSTRIYPGESVLLVDPTAWHNLPEDSRAYRDLQRFHGFADQLLASPPDEPHYVGDIRYAMLPTSARPLWGIVIDPEHPDGPIEFVTRREFTPEMRQRWLHMLRGVEE
jgi:inner membrane protein